MGDDKNHLYSKEDYQKDQQENAKRRTQQGFSRFSTSAATSLNDAGNTQAPPATQLETRPSWFRGINDTFDALSLVTVDVFFGTDTSGDRNYVTYNIVTVEDDVTFAFSGTPYGKMLPFTLDITIDKAVNPPEPIISWSTSVVNPPVLTGLLSNGTRHILHFETVRDAVSERQVYVGGTFSAASGAGSQTPWLSDIDASCFDLFEVDRVRFGDCSAVVFSTDDPSIFNGGAGTMVYNATLGTSSGHFWKTGDVTRMALVTDVTSNTVLDIRAGTGISDVALFQFQKIHPTPVTGGIIGETQYLGTRTGNAALVAYGSITVSYEDIVVGTHSGVMKFNVIEGGTTDKIFLQYNKNNTGTLEVFEPLEMLSNIISNIGGGTISDATDIVTVDTATDFLLILDASAPTNLKKVLVDDLIGGSQTPWLQDVDADEFDLFDLDRLRFADSSAVPVSPDDPSIFNGGGDVLVYNAKKGTALGHFWSTGDTVRMALTTDVTDNTILELKAGAAAADTPIFVFTKTNPTPITDALIGQIQWNGTRTGDSTLINYGSITVSYEDIVVGTHSGQMQFNVVTGGTTDKIFLRFNNGNTGILEVFEPLEMLSNKIANIGGDTIDEATDIGTVDDAADFVLIWDASDPTNLKKVRVDALVSAGTQTPWASDIDAATFDLFNLDRLSFFSGTSVTSTLAIGLSKSAADELRMNTIAGGAIIFTIEESEMLRITDVTNEVQAVDSILTVFRTGPPITRYQMVMASDRVILDHPDKQQFQIGSITQYELEDGLITFLTDKGVIANIDQLGFRTIGDIIEDDAGGMVYSTTPGESHRFRDNAVDFMELEINFARYGANFAQGGFYLDMFARANPGTTGDAQRGRIYFDSNNSNHLSVTRNAAGIDLESPITTKGDLETFDTINTRLPIGTDTFVLTADSAEATGMKWAPGGVGGGANQQLSNLAATVAINRNLIFNTTSADSMGNTDFGIGMGTTTRLEIKAGNVSGQIALQVGGTGATKVLIDVNKVALQTSTELHLEDSRIQMTDAPVESIKGINTTLAPPLNTVISEWSAFGNDDVTTNESRKYSRILLRVGDDAAAALGGTILFSAADSLTGTFDSYFEIQGAGGRCVFAKKILMFGAADILMNGNALFLDADADTKWQAGTDDVAQLTIGGGAGIMISVSGASIVFSTQLIMGAIIDMNSNDIEDVAAIEFIIDTSLPIGSIAYIQKNTVNMEFNVASGSGFIFHVANGGAILGIGVSLINTFVDIDMNTNDIIDCSSLASPSGTALSFKIAGSTKWQITSAGILNSLSSANHIHTSGADIDMGGTGDIIDCRSVGQLNHEVQFSAAHIRLFIFGSGDFISFNDGSGSPDRIVYEYDNDDFSPLNGISNLGKSGRRWIEVFALNGTINTSFSEFKQDIVVQPDSDCLAACVNLEPIKFRWIDGMFKDMKVGDKKTRNEAQIHFGYKGDSLRQDMPEAIAEGGDDIYEQSIIALLIGSVRHLKQKNEELEARLAALEP